MREVVYQTVVWSWERHGVTELKQSSGLHGGFPDAATLSNWTEELLQNNIGQVSTERIGPMGPGSNFRKPVRHEYTILYWYTVSIYKNNHHR